MAKSKKAPKSEGLQKFDPQNAGETIEGKFVQFQDSPTGMFLVLTTGVVSVSMILRKLLKSIYTQLRVGDSLVIRYEGKAGRAKNFSLQYNGTPIKAAFDIGAAASGEAVKDFFGDGFEFPAQGETKKGYKKPSAK